MKITTKEITRKLKRIFPKLYDWLPTDREYITIEPDEVRSYIDKLAEHRYLPRMWECEERSMAFVVDLKRDRLKNYDPIPQEERFDFALGEALGNKWQGEDMSHQANIFIAEDGVYLFDVWTKKIWKAEKHKDNIFFVRM